MIYKIKIISEIIYFILAGSGLFITGIAALKAKSMWKLKIIETVEKYLSKFINDYPVKDHKKTFRLIKISRKKPVYILNLKTKTKYWITTRLKFDSLGYSFSMVERVTPEELEKYKTGEPI